MRTSSKPTPDSIDPNQALVQLNDISVIRNQQAILDKVSLTLRPRELVSLIGPNGAGKSTLVRTLLGLMTPSSGTIEHAKGLKVGYMPQKLPIDHTLPVTVERFLKLSPGATQSNIDEVLEHVGIKYLKSSTLSVISGGELQRVLLSRALLQTPNLLVLDEPAQGVDINGQQEMYQLINQVRNDLNCTVLMVSHDLHLVMASTDHVLCLNKHICCEGSPEVVSRSPQYLALFGKSLDKTVALYTHHHDHQHNVHGDVVHKPEDETPST